MGLWPKQPWRTRRSAAESLLAVEQLIVPQEGGAGFVGPVSFSISRGETLGLVGLRGAGHHAVGRAIYGALPRYAGKITFEGKVLDLGDPAGAIANGIGFVSSRRGEESLARNLTVLENLYMNSLARGIGPFRPIARRKELSACRKALARFSVRPPDPTRVIATLSGGNQQKVVVARWMEAKVRLLILEEPTIGVDVGSKAEIYRDLRIADERGRAVLLISSDFEEVEKVCHRALVFSRGKLTATIERKDINVANLTTLAAGASHRSEKAAVNRRSSRQAQFASTLSHLVSVWGLLLLLVVLLLAFSIAKPDTFPTYFNFRSIVNNKSVQALLALAVFLPMTANHFDLSVGFLLGIAQVLVIGLQGQGLAWPLASAIVLLLGAAVGVANGILVTVVGIDSFIATLGTGTLLYGFNEWYTGGQQVVAGLPETLHQHLRRRVRRPVARDLCSGAEYFALGGFRVSACRPLLVCAGGESSSRRVERHLREALRDRRISGHGNHFSFCRDRPPVATSSRSEFSGTGISSSGVHGCSPWRDFRSTRSSQCLGHYTLRSRFLP